VSPTRNFAASHPSVPDLPPAPRSPRPPEVQEENHQGAQTGTNIQQRKITTLLKDDILKGLSYEIDFENVDKNGQILAFIRVAAGF
jgi:hypothetical protein